MEITIDLAAIAHHIWSWYGTIVWFILVIVGLIIGNLPDNETVHPFRTSLRWMFWVGGIIRLIVPLYYGMVSI